MFTERNFIIFRSKLILVHKLNRIFVVALVELIFSSVGRMFYTVWIHKSSKEPQEVSPLSTQSQT